MDAYRVVKMTSFFFLPYIFNFWCFFFNAVYPYQNLQKVSFPDRQYKAWILFYIFVVVKLMFNWNRLNQLCVPIDKCSKYTVPQPIDVYLREVNDGYENFNLLSEEVSIWIYNNNIYIYMIFNGICPKFLSNKMLVFSPQPLARG